MISILKEHPFKLFGLLTLLLYTPVYLLVYQLNLEGRGIGQFLIDTLPVWGAVYWIPDQLPSVLNDGRRFEGQLPLSVAIGVLACVLGDRMLYWIGKTRVSKDVSGDT